MDNKVRWIKDTREEQEILLEKYIQELAYYQNFYKHNPTKRQIGKIKTLKAKIKIIYETLDDLENQLNSNTEFRTYWKEVEDESM